MQKKQMGLKILTIGCLFAGVQAANAVNYTPDSASLEVGTGNKSQFVRAALSGTGEADGGNRTVLISAVTGI